MDQNETVGNSNTLAKRPTFITVLCIISFILSAFAFFNGFVSIIKANLANSAALAVNTLDSFESIIVIDSLSTPEQKNAQLFAKKILESTKSSFDSQKILYNAFSTFSYALLTLFGALLMWRLRKIGYWIYLFGIIISVVAPIVIYGSGNWIGIFASVVMGVIGLTMFILFTVNKEHLK